MPRTVKCKTSDISLPILQPLGKDKKYPQPTLVNTHLLGPYASQQLVLSQQEVPLEPPLGRVRRRDRILGTSKVDLVVFLEVKMGSSRPGIDGARHASESRVPAYGAEQPPHVCARLEARRAAQDPLLHAPYGHAIQRQEREPHLRNRQRFRVPVYVKCLRRE